MKYTLRSGGFTLVEVIIAMVIFAMVVISLLRAVTSADKIKGRGATVMAASILARNEAEIIKNIASTSREFHDTLYTSIVNRKEYTIERKVLDQQDLFSEPNPGKNIFEIKIIISEKNPSAKPFEFRLLQGIR